MIDPDQKVYIPRTENKILILVMHVRIPSAPRDAFRSQLHISLGIIVVGHIPVFYYQANLQDHPCDKHDPKNDRYFFPYHFFCSFWETKIQPFHR